MRRWPTTWRTPRWRSNRLMHLANPPLPHHADVDAHLADADLAEQPLMREENTSLPQHVEMVAHLADGELGEPLMMHQEHGPHPERARMRNHFSGRPWWRNHDTSRRITPPQQAPRHARTWRSNASAVATRQYSAQQPDVRAGNTSHHQHNGCARHGGAADRWRDAWRFRMTLLHLGARRRANTWRSHCRPAGTFRLHGRSTVK
jgi:hypothetical protein